MRRIRPLPGGRYPSRRRRVPLRIPDARIVVGIDGSLGSTRALRWTLEEARSRSATVEAAYAWQYPPVGAFVFGPTQGFEAVANETVDAATEYAERVAPDVRFIAHTCFDADVPVLLDAAEGAELLVVGSKGHGRFHDALLGRSLTNASATPSAL